MAERKKDAKETLNKHRKDTRRSFLKKSVYAAPTLIALGQLVKPKNAKAGFGGPPSDPDGPAW